VDRLSYQVLARKWRPANFQQLVGQEHVQRALVNALNDNRLHHAYLFSGTRGVGKTTIARIFTKSLNCETGITATPCGQCSTCREIAEGRYVDLIEVDAASRTGVDDTRELLENVQYAPTRGRYKVYLIDEVHMFSKSSFNALLKTLEEPPPHVKFLLATTEPQKLPVTILSRCLQFNLKRLPVSLITGHLQHILGEEKIEFNVSALQLIAEGADGSMRDALSLLDQALAFGGGVIREQEVRDMLGTVSRQQVLTILQAVFNHDAAMAMKEVALLNEFSPDYENVLAEILSVLHHMNLAKVVPEALDDYVSAKDQLLQLCEQVRAEDLQLFYQIGLIGRRDLPLSPDARSGFEMVLLRMLAFRPVTAKMAGSTASAAGQTQARTTASPPGSAEHAAVTATNGVESARAAIEAKTGIAESHDVSATTPVPAHEVRETAPPDSVENTVSVVPAPDKKDSSAPLQTSPPPDTDWCSIVRALSLGGLVKQLAINCVWKSREEGIIVLQLEQGHSNLLNPKAKLRLQQALGEYFDIDAQLQIEIIKTTVASPQSGMETPAQTLQREQQQRQQQAEQSINNDSFVQTLKETFNAEIIPGSVKPDISSER